MSKSTHDFLNQLDRQLLQTDDPLVIADIYYKAGEVHAALDDVEQACFFMTQAFVFAIHHGDKIIASNAKKFLTSHNRI